MKTKEIKCLVVKSENKPEVLTVNDTLETWEKLVDGYIEIVHPFEDNVILIVDEGFLLKPDKEPNRIVIYDNSKSSILIFGDFVIVAEDGHGNFKSLTDEQIRKYSEKFDKTYIEQLVSVVFGI